MNKLTSIQNLLLECLLKKHINELEKSIQDCISIGQMTISNILKKELQEFKEILQEFEIK